MKYLILNFYQFVCTVIPAFVTYLVLKRYKRNQCGAAVPSTILAGIFSVYLFALLYFTGAGTLHDALRFGIDLNPHQINLIPFANFTEDVVGHALNVLLFVPIGLLVPLLSDGCPRALPIVVTAIASSLVIEVSQLLNSRITDIDDLLMNVTGALIGYYVFRMIDQKKEKQSDQVSGINIAAAMITATFLGRFLLYDEMGLAKMLFGF